MTRILGKVIFITGVILLLVFSGCDTRNSPDVPPQPYHVAAVYGLPAEAKHMDAKGDLVAVAASSYGTVVLNVHDLAHINTVFRIPEDTLQGRLFGASRVALDTVNHVVTFGTEPRDENAAARVVNYLTGTVEWFSTITGQGPYYVFVLESSPNQMTFFESEHTRFNGKRLCRDTDTSGWVDGTCPLPFSEYVCPDVTDGSTQNRGRGMAHRLRDGVVALAVEEAGVHFLIDSLGSPPISTMLIPGSAWDCKWYQDSLLVVAADFQMVILNVSDVHHPRIVSQYMISTSNHMRGVAIDGNWACMMDGYDGIYVVDISDTRHPVNVQLLKLPHPTSVCVDNGRLYATDEASGLVIYER